MTTADFRVCGFLFVKFSKNKDSPHFFAKKNYLCHKLSQKGGYFAV